MSHWQHQRSGVLLMEPGLSTEKRPRIVSEKRSLLKKLLLELGTKEQAAFLWVSVNTQRLRLRLANSRSR